MGADGNRAIGDHSSVEDIKKKGEEINQNAGSYELGENISHTPGTCEEVKVGEKRDYYDGTCDVGVTVTTPDGVEELSCPDGYTLVGRTCTKTATICTILRIMLARCSRAKLACASASQERSEENTSAHKSPMRIAYAHYC